MLKITKEQRANWNGVPVPIMSHEMNGKKWNEMFDSEAELIEALKNMDTIKAHDNGYNGMSYLYSFNRMVKENKPLSPKQLTQLKRLASEVYCYTWNEMNTNYHNRRK